MAPSWNWNFEDQAWRELESTQANLSINTFLMPHPRRAVHEDELKNYPHLRFDVKYYTGELMSVTKPEQLFYINPQHGIVLYKINEDPQEAGWNYHGWEEGETAEDMEAEMHEKEKLEEDKDCVAPETAQLVQSSLS